MAITGAQSRITQAVMTWEGMVNLPHRFGGVEYRLGKREIGHIHGDHLVDVPFPTKVRDELVAAGMAQPHHVLADSGWVSFYLNQPSDVDRAVDLLHRSYEIAMRQRARRQPPDQPSS